MKKVMLGWELGANSGHATRLLRLGKALAAIGYDVVYAVQQLDALSDGTQKRIVQAPIWPQLLRTLPVSRSPVPRSFADILARVGLGEAGTLSSLIGGWEQLIELIEPDAIVADFAPALCCAAKQRVPVLSIGTPFCQPPASMEKFPGFFDQAASMAETHLLAVTNAELLRTGRKPLAHLPELFATDCALVAGFQELDPYRRWRVSPYVAPTAQMADSQRAKNGDEIFAYFYRSDGPATRLWDALELTQLPVRVFVLRSTIAERLTLQRRGFHVETAPVAWDQIAARSRMVISHGGMGFVSSALLAGLPQLVLHYDIEKMLNGRGVQAIGVGVERSILNVTAPELSSIITFVYHDQALAKSAIEKSPLFRARMKGDPFKAASEQIANLIALG